MRRAAYSWIRGGSVNRNFGRVKNIVTVVFGCSRELFGLEVVIEISGDCFGSKNRLVLLKETCDVLEWFRNHLQRIFVWVRYVVFIVVSRTL